MVGCGKAFPHLLDWTGGKLRGSCLIFRCAAPKRDKALKILPFVSANSTQATKKAARQGGAFTKDLI
jgi:hypothetical protein